MCETDTRERFSFRISLRDDEEGRNPEYPEVPEELRRRYQEDGFISVPNVLDIVDVDALTDRLENIIRGEYNTRKKPDKAPKLVKSGYQAGQFSVTRKCIQDTNQSPEEEKASKSQSTEQKKTKSCAKGPLGFSGNLSNVKVLQLINVHKCDRLFRKLVTSRQLGKVVADLAGWEQGARLAQDQVWAKPPGAPPLVFHRDSPYFMFDDNRVVTVWIALDTMDAELGPLEYVKGSHLWGEGRVGTSKQFYQHTGGMKLMLSAAASEGLSMEDLDIISMAGLEAGGISIHNGRTWHGSSRNASETRPRRGVGLHFVPKNVKFTADARHSKLWKGYWERDGAELCPEDFPVVYGQS